MNKTLELVVFRKYDFPLIPEKLFNLYLSQLHID